MAQYKNCPFHLSLSLIILLSSCATLNFGNNDHGLVRDSVLSNLNPAPQIFEPPGPSKDGTPQIDQVYLQSQSDYHFTLAESYSLDGDSEKAIEEFKLTLIYDPNSVIIRLRLALEYIRLGLISESIENAEMAVSMDPKSVEGRLLLGGLYSSIKMFDKAVSEYESILNFEPKNSEAKTYLGAILAEQKKYNEAIEVFEQLAKFDGAKNRSRANYYIGRIQIELGGDENFKKAEKSFIKSLSEDPSDVESVMALGRLYEQQEKQAQLKKLLESFQDKFGPERKISEQLSNIYLENEEFELAAKQLEYLEGFEPDNLSVKFRLALLFLEKKDFESARSRLERLVELEPQSDRARFYLAATYESLEMYPEAVLNFNQIPALSNFYPDAIIHSAYLSKKQLKYDEAIETLDLAISRRNDVPKFYALYASLLDETKNYSKAAELLGNGVKLFPEDTQLLFFLGSIHDRMGQSEQTILQMRKVIELDQNHVQALNFLAYTYAELNQNLEEAEELARKALMLQPKDGYILDTLGWVLYKQDKIKESILTLESAYKLKSTESIIAEHLGDAYYRYDLLEKARQMYLKAVDFEKDKSKVQKIKDKIAVIENTKPFPNDADQRRPASSESP